jgi:hypothetical protein
MHIGIPPVDKLAVHPDFTVAICIRSRHCALLSIFPFVAQFMTEVDIILR